MIPSDLDSESGSPLVDGVRSLSSSGRLGSLHLRPVFPPTAVCAFAHSSPSHKYINLNRNPASILDYKYVNILAGVYRSDLVHPSLKYLDDGIKHGRCDHAWTESTRGNEYLDGMLP